MVVVLKANAAVSRDIRMYTLYFDPTVTDAHIMHMDMEFRVSSTQLACISGTVVCSSSLAI